MQLSRRDLFSTAGSVVALGVAGLAVHTGMTYQPRVVDYTGHLHPDHPRIKREKTYFATVHCTNQNQDELNDSLRILTSPWRSAHYLIGRNGVIFRLVPEDLVSFHNGVSRWNGIENLNLFSLGIEFIGYGSQPFTEEQYTAFKYLYRDGINLRGKYDFKDSDVLFHSWVAYCRDNRTHNESKLDGEHTMPHRGRKSDPGFLFDRFKAGLYDSPVHDQDVRNGAISSNPDGPRLIIASEKRELAVEEGGQEVKRFAVSIDKGGPKQMKKGQFIVANKSRNHSSHIFGSNYLEATNGERNFLIHGTPDTTLHGINLWGRKYLHDIYPGYNDWTERGNVAMSDEDIRMIYMNILTGTPVEVR